MMFALNASVQNCMEIIASALRLEKEFKGTQIGMYKS